MNHLKDFKSDKFGIWIGLLGSFVSAVAVSITFMFSTFATKEMVQQQNQWLIRELNSIQIQLSDLNKKLDHMRRDP